MEYIILPYSFYTPIHTHTHKHTPTYTHTHIQAEEASVSGGLDSLTLSAALTNYRQFVVDDAASDDDDAEWD
jgi:hypothetical protein